MKLPRLQLHLSTLLIVTLVAGGALLVFSGQGENYSGKSGWKDGRRISFIDDSTTVSTPTPLAWFPERGVRWGWPLPCRFVYQNRDDSGWWCFPEEEWDIVAAVADGAVIVCLALGLVTVLRSILGARRDRSKP